MERYVATGSCITRTHHVALALFIWVTFQTVLVCAPAGLWGGEWEVTRGERRHWKQPRTPWGNLSTHFVSLWHGLKVWKGLRQQVYTGWILRTPTENGKPHVSSGYLLEIYIAVGVTTNPQIVVMTTIKYYQLYDIIPKMGQILMLTFISI